MATPIDAAKSLGIRFGDQTVDKGTEIDPLTVVESQPLRGCVDEIRELLIGIIRREKATEYGHRIEHDDDDAPDHRQLVLFEAQPHQPPL